MPRAEQPQKCCSKCGLFKLITAFYKMTNGGRESQCIDCRKTLFKEYRENNKAVIQERSRLWYQKNSAKISQLNKKRRQGLKYQVFCHYGGICCACCGESHIEFLSIDHIDGYANTVPKTPRKGDSLYRWLRDNNYPEGFRVLCMNCNFSLGHFGYCPHKLNKEELV